MKARTKTQRLPLPSRQQVIWSIGAAVIACSLVFVRLGSLTSGISQDEAALLKNPISLGNIYHNPLNLPVGLLRFICYGAWHAHSAFLLRLPNALLGLTALIALAVLLKRWYGTRIATFGAILFVFSPWFLHAARLASIDAEQLFAITTLIMAIAGLSREEPGSFVVYGSAVALSLLVYVPGMIWFVVAALVVQPAVVAHIWRFLKSWRQRLLYLLVVLLPLGLLIRAFIAQPNLWRPWLALPQHLASPLSVLQHMGEGVTSFFWQAPYQPAMWLDRLPILNVFSMVMLLAGILFYGRHWLAPRTRLLLVLFWVSMALFGLGGSATLSFAVPIVYSVAAAGIGYLLHEWLRVFPRNPLARGVGIGLVAITLCMSCAYNLRSYFVAWPHNPHTQAAFHRQS